MEHFLKELNCLIVSLSLCITTCMMADCIAYSNGIWNLLTCLICLLVISLSVVFMHGVNFLTMMQVCLSHSLFISLF